MSSVKTISGPWTLSRRHGLFGLFSAALLLFALESIRTLMSLLTTADTNNSHSSYILLIPFISATLIFNNREKVFSEVGSSLFAGAMAFAAGGLLHYLGRIHPLSPDESINVGIATAAVVILWYGVFLVVYGSAAFKAALFPLVFLSLTVPLPDPLIHRCVLLLQKGSADLVSILFTLAQTPFFRSGDFVFSLPTVAIEVAEECSGIRSTIGMLVVALLAAHFLLRSNWKRLALVVVVIPISLFKNALRIVILTLLAVHYDMSFLTGSLHHEGGIFFMMGGLAMTYPVLSVLVRSERKNSETGARA